MRREPQAGSTLVELMCSVAIFSLGLLMLLGVATHARAAAERASYGYKAHVLAKSHIERLKAYAFTQLPSAAETQTTVDQEGIADANGSFIRSTEVTASYLGDSALTQVKVTVSYLMKGVESAQPMEVTEVLYGGA